MNSVVGGLERTVKPSPLMAVKPLFVALAEHRLAD